MAQLLHRERAVKHWLCEERVRARLPILLCVIFYLCHIDMNFAIRSYRLV